MTRTVCWVVVAAVVAGSLIASSDAAPPGTATAKPLPYENPSLAVVFSETDNDAQLFISTGSTSPMASVSVLSPRGKRLITAVFRGSPELGQADFRVDTPEPSLAKLRRAYPPGIYEWEGRSVGGRRLTGRSRLSYKLLDPPIITAPAAGATDLPVSGAVVRWEPVADASSIHLEVEQPARERTLSVDLDGDATSFVIPDGFLDRGREYVVDVKAVGANGNLTVADRAFRTG